MQGGIGKTQSTYNLEGIRTMYTDQEYKKLAKKHRMGMKIGRYVFRNHTSSRFHGWLKKKLVAINNKQYPADSLDFLRDEDIWHEE